MRHFPMGIVQVSDNFLDWPREWKRPGNKATRRHDLFAFATNRQGPRCQDSDMQNPIGSAKNVPDHWRPRHCVPLTLLTRPFIRGPQCSAQLTGSFVVVDQLLHMSRVQGLPWMHLGDVRHEPVAILQGNAAPQTLPPVMVLFTRRRCLWQLPALPFMLPRPLIRPGR